MMEKDILYSKRVKAGKRIYFFDVKQDKRGEVYLSLTESKRLRTEDENEMAFEKHKVFIYNEDFENFREAFLDVIDFAKAKSTEKGENKLDYNPNIDLNIEF